MAEIIFPTAFSVWDEAEVAAIDRVLASEKFTMGPEVAAFEAELAAFHGRKHCVAVNSGSSANLIALAALFHVKDRPLKRGDKVIVPALAWSTTFAPLVQYGLDLVLVDCDDGWNADLYGKLNTPDGVRLVVGCSILGNPAALEGWKTAAGVLDAYFINDDCESLGARVAGATTGSLGLIATESFFYSHQVSAIEGGAILTDYDELADICRILRAHGWTRDVKPAATFDDEYNFVAFGYNVRPLEMHAAIAREQLKKLPTFINERLANMGLFRRLTEGLPIAHPTMNGEPSPFGLHFEVDDRATRGRLATALRAAGIDCRLPTGGSFTRHAYGKPWASQETPRADLVHDTGLFLGNGPLDLTEQITAAVNIIKENV